MFVMAITVELITVFWSTLYICSIKHLNQDSSINKKMFSPADSILFTPDIEALELELHNVNTQMEQFSKEGKYILAQNCKINAEKLKKNIEAKRLEEVHKRHQKENKQIKRYLKDDLATFNAQWDMKLKEQQEMGKSLIRDLKERHQKEQAQERTRIEAQVPKRKQSSEVLNLKVIQLNLAKQLNFIEAQMVQKQVQSLEKKQQEEWEKQTKQKIEKEIEELKAKHLIQLHGLEKKIASNKWSLQIEKTKAEAKLVLKHSVVVKELKTENKKQSLAVKGEFKSKCNVLSPSRSILSPSKSRILSSTGSKFMPNMTR